MLYNAKREFCKCKKFAFKLLALDNTTNSRYSAFMENSIREKLRSDIVFEARVRKHDFVFHARYGMFSPKKIDEGTYLLHHSIHVNETDVILDLGCGYGALGIPLAHDALSGSVDMVDSNFKAIEYTKKNCDVNNIKNVSAFLSFGFDEIPKEKKYNVIVSNLPANVGREMLYTLLNDAKDHLADGGKIYVVTIAGLRNFIKTNFENVFGNYEKISQERGYTVAAAVK